jgi:hypothetical protein
LKPSFFIAVVIVLGVLFVYSWVERNINQRGCRECGFRISVEAAERQCPRCGAVM